MPGYGGHDIVGLMDAAGITPRNISAAIADFVATNTILRDMGFPLLRVNEALTTFIRWGGSEGLAAPFGGVGTPAESTLPPMSINQTTFQKFADRMTFNEEDLEGFERLARAGATELGDSAEMIIAKTAQFLGSKMVNRGNWMVSKTVFDGSYSINENGVVYTANMDVPNNFRLDLNDSPATNHLDVRDLSGTDNWTPSALWNGDVADTQPVRDLKKARRYFESITGGSVTAIVMRPETYDLITDSNSITDLLKTRTFDVTDPNTVTSLLKLPKIITMNQSYTLRRGVTASSAAGVSTIVLSSFANIEKNDRIKLYHADGSLLEFNVVAATPTTTTITLGMPLQNALSPNSYVEIIKNFIPFNKIAFITDRPNQMLIDMPYQSNNNQAGMSVEIKDESLYAGQKQMGVSTKQKFGTYVREAGGFGTLTVLAP